MFGNTVRTAIRTTAAMLTIVLSPIAAAAQSPAKGIPLHVSSRWKECAIQLDPALTQQAWRQFTQEAALVAYFRPLTDARPMGRGKYELSLLQYNTAIDDRTSAWNDTFVHPDSAHWLFEGSGLKFPGLMVRAGVTDRVDVGAYFTRNPAANYGFYGAQVQYSVVNEAARGWSGAVRGSFVSLFGPEDVKLSIAGVDAVVSKTYALRSWLAVSPYTGASAYVSRSRETSPVVNLAGETTGGLQAMGGLAVQVTKARVAYEYNTARVASRSLKVSVAF